MSVSADRNLLFGILAVQLDFVTQDELMAGMNAWLLDKSKPLGDVLRDLGHLPQGRLQLLDALVEEHLRKHDNDTGQSLAALSSVEPALRHSLAALADQDVRATLIQTGSRRARHTADNPATPPGRYEILRAHAKGGLGEVFVAEDTELHRPVALKEIQARHADDPDSRARFVLEAEITGGLEHPGVVPVYGLGTYADGRPYYAMRFVRGDNLQQAIQRFHIQTPQSPPVATGGVEARPSPRAGFDSLQFRELLGRFVDVCNAVAYAHSRGVLHRDLKPGNVMLGAFGETLVVDWGLAKATGRASGEAGDATLRPHSGAESSATVVGRALGTPAYMSPEQADGRLDDLGPATDVYSLGASLYELLTGRPPFAAVDLDAVQKGLFPPPRQVIPGVPRALDAVCLKAMALRPADRYATTLALAQDVERWLADEPVTAYPEPAGARLRRWVRKHARLVTGLAVTLLVGIAALGLLAWQRELARRAVDAERGKAVEAAAAERTANELAQKRLAQVEKFNDILGSMFKDLDPHTAEEAGKPLQAVLGERLDRAAAAIAGEAIGDALAVARMQATLGQSQLSLGYPEKAVQLLTLARATLTANLGPDHRETLTCANDLAEGYRDTGRLDLARPLQEETFARMKATLGPDHPHTLTAMSNLASGYTAAGQLNRALPLLEETLTLQTAKLGPDHPLTLATRNNLAGGHRSAGRLDRALPLYEESLRLVSAKHGPDHPHTLASMNNLGASYLSAGQLDRALPLLEDTLTRRKAKLGPDHPDTLLTTTNLAIGYRTAGQLDRALPLYEEVVTRRRAKLGPDHLDTLRSLGNLASGYVAAGRNDQAEALLREMADITKRKSGADSPQYARALASLGLNLLVQKKWSDAEPVLRECLAIRDKVEPDAWTKFDAQSMLGESLLGQGKLADAEPLLLAGYDGLKRRADTIPKDARFRLPDVAERLVRLYDALGKADDAAKWRSELETLKMTK